MKINEFDDIAINGQFDLVFRDTCPDHPAVSWKLLKSLAFNESELQPYVNGGLFRIPDRLFIEFEGRDSQDPEDSTKVVSKILISWWEELQHLPEEDRIKYVVLAYKLKFYDIQKLAAITSNFDDFFNYFSPGLILEVKKIIEYSKVL